MQLTITPTMILSAVFAVLVFAVLITVRRQARAAVAALERARIAEEASKIVPRAPFTEARRAAIMEGLQVHTGTWANLGEDVTGPEAQGTAAMLYGQGQWMARQLDDILRFHVNVAPSLGVEDEPSTQPFLDRMRGKLAFGRDKGERRQ